MVRVLVAALHTFLAVAMASGGLLVLTQARLAATWERGFYGELSMVTNAVLVASGLLLTISTLQLVSSLGHAAGRRWGAWGLLGVSALLAFRLPPPMSWLVAGGAGSLMYELWVTRPRPPRDPDEDTEEA